MFGERSPNEQNTGGHRYTGHIESSTKGVTVQLLDTMTQVLTSVCLLLNAVGAAVELFRVFRDDTEDKKR